MCIATVMPGTARAISRRDSRCPTRPYNRPAIRMFWRGWMSIHDGGDAVFGADAQRLEAAGETRDTGMKLRLSLAAITEDQC